MQFQLGSMSVHAHLRPSLTLRVKNRGFRKIITYDTQCNVSLNMETEFNADQFKTWLQFELSTTWLFIAMHDFEKSRLIAHV